MVQMTDLKSLYLVEAILATTQKKLVSIARLLFYVKLLLMLDLKGCLLGLMGKTWPEHARGGYYLLEFDQCPIIRRQSPFKYLADQATKVLGTRTIAIYSMGIQPWSTGLRNL